MSRPALLLIFLLGIWCGATVFMWQTAIRNFAVAERLAASDNAGFREAVEGLSAENLRAAVRYQASEVNRLFFAGWGWVQIPIALLAAVLVWKLKAGRFVSVAVGTMLLITLFLQFYVVPETVRVGRLIDFVEEGELVAETSYFWTLHHSYTALDMLKFVLALATATVQTFRKAS